MKRFLRTQCCAIALLILAAIAVNAQDELHQTYPLSANGTVSLSNVSGPVRITSWNENRVQVDAVKRGNREDFALVEFRVTDSPERLQIETISQRTNWRGNRNVWVEYDLKVPRSAVLNPITTTSGNITINDAGSRVVARSTSGDVTLRGINGDTKVSVTSGNISAERMGGALAITSTSGDLHINEVSANLTATTTSGNITAIDLRADVSVAATSGDIRVERASGR
ncbi:MAG TPA: DUF4097 family beta strand repeat-containing protein, partial [Blastocatellia bacterium]|nr:DUF4097 family beta strand repeat-containing protein [Blastocatellia bacterium]